MTAAATRFNRRYWVPEVVQTSAMDCGPASLKCLLEGFNIPVSYGRLREACQTDVDGTSIDVIETVANRLGIVAEQVMLPVEHLFLTEAATLPAMVVVRQANGYTHFVVAWRRHGNWLQIMDPAVGRRWTHRDQFVNELYRHQLSVPAQAWREWAASEAFLNPLRERLNLLGASETDGKRLIADATASPGWRHLATVDAAVRMVDALVRADGIASGADAVALLNALVERGLNAGAEAETVIPACYWTVAPGSNRGNGNEDIVLHGAVLLKAINKRDGIADAPDAGLSPELAAALSEKPSHPGFLLLNWLRDDGLLAPVALCGAMAIAVSGVLIETLLFRGLFDIAWELNLANQRLGAIVALVLFMGLMLMMEVPIATEAQRLGRHLELRLRMALFSKLPKLNDRYFQSRPISDMAERSHSVHLTKQIPGLGIRYVQAGWDLLFTLAGIIIIDAGAAAFALCLAFMAIGIPFALQPLMNERDLRLRSHAGALHNFYLDALLGIVPIRTHKAEKAIGREHEALLVEWARSGRSLIRISLLAKGTQSLFCFGLAGLLLLDHFHRVGVSGSVLLLTYWTLKLPAIGQNIIALAHQYPAQRNILLRLLEPLSAPEEIYPLDQADSATVVQPDDSDLPDSNGVSIAIEGGSVLASGHTILEDINLKIAAGEHIAIVGVSGAGKSTLLGLLLGWHRLTAGQLLINGTTLTADAQERLRSKTAWVDPAVQIWNRSFLDNLCYSSKDKAYSDLGATIAASDLKGVLQKLPDGMQTHLGEGGALLSGGEGQRVRLGRAVSQTDSQLVLLDEPFRGLDRSQRRRLLLHARERWRDATLLCVTHDVGETLLFDRVLVVDDGIIVEDACPRNLAATPSRYRDLLDADASVHGDLWEADDWRRLTISDGQLSTSEEANSE